MRRLYRMTLQRPEMNSQGQIAPTRVSLTSSRPQELLIGQLLRNVHNEILYTKALEYREYFTHIAVQKMTKSSGDIQDLVDMKFRIFGQAVSKYMIVSLCVMF